jgi:hypothetical protein
LYSSKSAFFSAVPLAFVSERFRDGEACDNFVRETKKRLKRKFSKQDYSYLAEY